jgi:hypothetical protein
MAGGDWFEGNGTGGAVDAGEILLACSGALFEIVAAGALLSIGLTSDGGALGVTVTVDGRWRREYFRQSDELEVWLAEAIPAVVTARNGAAASSGRAGGSRRRQKA